LPETLKNCSTNFLEKAQLMKPEKSAMRAGLQFRALPLIERVLVDLTVKVADSIRSTLMANCILAIAEKLENFIENKLSRAIREIGLPTIAHKLSIHFGQGRGLCLK
jgi:hypothetical protein